PVKPPTDKFVALTVMDANDDGVLDILALRADGAVVRISDRDKRQSLEVAPLGPWDEAARNAEPGTRRIIAGDFENNGAIDILMSGPEGSRLWLQSGKGNFQSMRKGGLPAESLAAADLDGTGRLDLIARDLDGQLYELCPTPTKNYHWQALRLQAR